MVELIGAGLAAGLAAVGAGIGNGFLFGKIYRRCISPTRIRIKIKI